MSYTPTHAAVIEGEVYTADVVPHTTPAASGPYLRPQVDVLRRPFPSRCLGAGVIYASLALFAVLGVVGFLLGLARGL